MFLISKVKYVAYYVSDSERKVRGLLSFGIRKKSAWFIRFLILKEKYGLIIFLIPKEMCVAYYVSDYERKVRGLLSFRFRKKSTGLIIFLIPKEKYVAYYVSDFERKVRAYYLLISKEKYGAY
ncbi:hypothetical protein CEXT_672781 [Caerostris extrusa]|uniref:Uncharacterized protein n=1 Tax=Caerostris extrusa TaxID=172846 RepID=A0AAV4WQI5_CAEEX|nr:hypothetical protein CEXT_672781 [Caerostris extrusa]